MWWGSQRQASGGAANRPEIARWQGTVPPRGQYDPVHRCEEPYTVSQGASDIHSNHYFAITARPGDGAAVARRESREVNVFVEGRAVERRTGRTLSQLAVAEYNL